MTGRRLWDSSVRCSSRIRDSTSTSRMACATVDASSPSLQLYLRIQARIWFPEHLGLCFSKFNTILNDVPIYWGPPKVQEENPASINWDILLTYGWGLHTTWGHSDQPEILGIPVSGGVQVAYPPSSRDPCNITKLVSADDNIGLAKFMVRGH